MTLPPLTETDASGDVPSDPASGFGQNHRVGIPSSCTAYNVSVMGDETSKKFAELVKRDYIDQGKLGVATGEGFYRYS